MATIARTPAVGVLLAAAAAAWVVAVERMAGVDAGPGTDLGGIGWYLGVWVAMTSAMMLPTTVRVARAVSFALGYLAVWTVFGLAAYVVFRNGMSTDVAGVVLGAAGVYQVTSFKRRSLGRCRMADGVGELRAGVRHGLDCVGSSGGLMAALFALGLMSLPWMAAIAVAIFAEKVLPQGPRLSGVFAVALVVLGIGMAMSPGDVPGLGGMEMEG